MATLDTTLFCRWCERLGSACSCSKLECMGRYPGVLDLPCVGPRHHNGRHVWGRRNG